MEISVSSHRSPRTGSGLPLSVYGGDERGRVAKAQAFVFQWKNKVMDSRTSPPPPLTRVGIRDSCCLIIYDS